jgi:hypothetical protein
MKSITISTDDELEQAMEDDMDEIVIEGGLAERVSFAYDKVRKLRRLFPFLAIAFALILAGIALLLRQAEGYEEIPAESGSPDGRARTILRKKAGRKKLPAAKTRLTDE